MKNKLAAWALVAFSFLAFQNAASAQLKEDRPKEETEEPTVKKKKNTKKTTKKTEKKKSASDEFFDESGNWKARLQYGVLLSPNIFAFDGRQFNFRLEPLVGYKITNWASAGVIGGIDYYYFSLQNSLGERVVAQPIDLSAGIYSRIKVFDPLLIHADYRSTRYSRLTGLLDPTNTRKAEIAQTTKPELNLGAVYRAGGAGWTYEIMATYNTLYNDSYFDWKASPIDVKIGFSYNF